MRKVLFLVLVLASNGIMAQLSADSVCKNLKSCSEWMSKKTGVIFDLGKMERRSLKTEKDFDLSEGDPETLFSYILSQSDMTKIKRDSGAYEVIALREIKDFTFPVLKNEEIRPSYDIQATEFVFSNNIKLKNAVLMIKKLISKNGRVVQASEGNRIFVTDTGFQLIMFKNLISELNK